MGHKNQFHYLDTLKEKGLIDDKFIHLIQDFYGNYCQEIAKTPYNEKNQELFNQLIDQVIKQIEEPYQFPIFHKGIRQPFDYYQFGLDFIRPLIDFTRSKIEGLNHLQTILEQIKKGENVVLLANHQTEPDPQILSLLLLDIDPELAANMVFIAGHRVIKDPLAIPMSLGRNLLCIYSKKHMDHPADEKAKKMRHNQRTMKKMTELLSEGGYCIYVAPSGGRDRPNASNEIEVASFNPQSLELFRLQALQATRPTHFYPLALKTYHLMPPPHHIEREVGEKRYVHQSAVYLSFGAEIDMEYFPNSEKLNKQDKRNQRATYIWEIVQKAYKAFPSQ